jgi:hypothetical protein
MGDLKNACVLMATFRSLRTIETEVPDSYRRGMKIPESSSTAALSALQVPTWLRDRGTFIPFLKIFSLPQKKYHHFGLDLS